MLNLVVLLLLAATLGAVSPSPFELTQNYVEEFQKGMAALRHEAEKHVFTETDFDPAHYEVDPHAEEYDFVVVGGGAAGAVIANRLTERPEWRVLLLEAGDKETPYTQIPALGHMLQSTDYNWAYVTTPQKNWCKGMIDNKCAIAGGKALGGGTAINGMLYTRGNAQDYNRWADLGNDGWCYTDLLPYFKKLEDADLPHADPKYHHRGGPFHIEHPQHHTQLKDRALKAGQEAGLDLVDYNGKQQLGVGVVQVNTRHGKRQSTAQAYLTPASKRDNLTIRPRSHVLKILVAPHTKQATGVEYVHNGKLMVAKASKEVVLSAGTINTAQILMLSGIGPKEDLEPMGIPLVADLKVGHNFKDHIAFPGLDFIYQHPESEEVTEQDLILDYLKNGKGPLTTGGCEVIAYLHTNISKEPLHYPDVEIFFYDRHLASNPGLNPFRYKKEVFHSLWKDYNRTKAVNIGVMLAHPKSTGRVTLQDTDPFHRPLVDPNQLSDPDDQDLNTLLAGIRKAVAISHTPTFEEMGVAINKNPVAGCEELEWGGDEYWKCAIKHLSISLRHVTGTARMGPKTDPGAVVDHTLKVYGVQRLRVADASVIPVTITGHTMAPAVMIGEKASDLIKEEWK